MNETSRHLAAGSELPALQKDTLRVYSMRYCPYAQRTRMVLVHKNIPVETVNVNLKNKPDWFLVRNPQGLVPVLEYNDKVVYESAVCDDYLDEIYPEKKLQPADPYTRARQRILMETYGKVITLWYQLLRAAADEQQEAQERFEKALQPYEDALQGKFFGGDDLSMLDVHIWPWLERTAVLQEDTDVMSAARLPSLHAYMDAMRRHPTVRATMYDADTHLAFFASYGSGNPQYDDL